ncbi:amidohydrolase family protein [Evansella sp. AB-rgal1]|uniref:N-acyl-D-amino-acid deacylase family protein n=1 Tax=Evansella sp. AB-rgal1 TaxID=3242696 RepID=UPI00359E42E4
MKVDILIKNGLVVDGSGTPGKIADIGIKDDKIMIADEYSDWFEIIDASGLVVAPGFIDIHTHSDLTLLVDSRGASKISQGVTSEIIGNCGLSTTPCSPEYKNEIKDSCSFLYANTVNWTWNSYSDYLNVFKEQGISLNVGFYIGHGTLRATVMGYDNRKPTSEELDQMKAYIVEGMTQGALGLSTGLIYPPGCYADTEEIVALCKVVADYNGVYSTHMRDEADGLMDSIEESLEIARRANVSLQISHLKAVGKQNWGKVKDAVKRIDEARKENIDVHYDFYPYSASSTYLSSLLPSWVLDGGWEQAAKRITDVTTRAKISSEIMQDFNEVMIATVNTEENRRFEGKTISEMSSVLEKEEKEVFFDLLIEEEGAVSMVKFSMNEEDVISAASGKHAMVGSDGFAIATDGPLATGKPHPRSYGSFPRVFSKYQRELQVLTIEEAVNKMSGAPANKLGLKDRGYIKQGFIADIVIFDPLEIRDMATFLDPHQYSKGVQTVFLSGKKAYENGTFLDPKSGVLLRPNWKN